MGVDPNDVQDIISNSGSHRFVVWDNILVFCDSDADERDYIVTIIENYDYLIEGATLTIVPQLTSGQDIKVTTFTNSNKMDIRTYVFAGDPDGSYTIPSARDLSAFWVTLDGKRLVNGVDFRLSYTDLAKFDHFGYDSGPYDDGTLVRVLFQNIPSDPSHRIVITIFEGSPGYEPATWQVATTAADIARYVPQTGGANPYAIIPGAWEALDIDRDQRGGVLTAECRYDSASIILNCNPKNIPARMVPLDPLMRPDTTAKKPGVIWIGAERIEYFGYDRQGDIITLTALRRGTNGTPRSQPHHIGDAVYAASVILREAPAIAA
jgi:hypothetical protein